MEEGNFTDLETIVEADETATWEAGRRAWSIVLTLAFVSLIVALDATILVTALPVRLGAVSRYWHIADCV